MIPLGTAVIGNITSRASIYLQNFGGLLERQSQYHPSWIPAFAGMTEGGVDHALDERVHGPRHRRRLAWCSMLQTHLECVNNVA